jgi:hypothetical protein
VYETEIAKEPRPTADAIRALMKAKITALGPSNVSPHCADFAAVVTLDISPSSIDRKAEFIHEAEQAKADGRLKKFIKPPADPAYHLEVPAS